MVEGFDPYHVWLGIPSSELPANYYRLLGIPVFEASQDVIDSAADRQTAHLRTFQVGKHGSIAQRLLNEVAAARVRLLNPSHKTAYDEKLRARAAASLIAPAASTNATSVKAALASPIAPNRAPLRRAAAIGEFATSAAPVSNAPADPEWDALLGGAATNLAPPTKKRSSSGQTVVQSNRRRNSFAIIAGVALAIVAAAVLASRRSPPTALAFDWPAADRVGSAMTVDGAPVAIPIQGAWEYPCEPGQRHVVVQRPAYKPFDTLVAVEAGQRPAVSAVWDPKATLAISWPIVERRGAELKIDGHVRSLGEFAAIELAVEPGQHVVQVERPGGQAFETTVTVALDQRRVVTVAREAAPTLIVNWPVEQRRGAQLSIDGKIRPYSNSPGMEFELKPGDHTVRITRPGFQPFEQIVRIASSGNTPLAPAWTEDQVASTSTAPVVETTNISNAKPTDPANEAGNAASIALPQQTLPENAAPAPQMKATVPQRKQTIPSVAEQDKIGKELESIYKLDRGAAKTQVDANALYSMADKPGASPAERYMLYMKGAEFAARAGDFNLAFQGVDLASADFEFNPFEAKQKLLGKFVLVAKTADQLDSLTMVAEPLIDEAIAADRYEAALSIAATATKALARRPGDLQLRKQIEERLDHRRQEIHALEPLLASARRAQATLDTDPTNAEANLTIGRWDCLVKENWKAGLPQLAQGNDERLKSRALQELKAPADVEAQLALAEAWWSLAKMETPLYRERIQRHAGEWYRAALPNVTSALKRVAIETKLKEISKPRQMNRMPLGQWFDLLPLVDLARHAKVGNWTRRGSDVMCTPLEGSRIDFPITVQGSYDMEVVFTRTIGNCDITALAPVGSHYAIANLSGFGGGASGLDHLDGRLVDNHDNPIAVRPGGLENNRRYRELIRVRWLAEARATVDVALDGKPYFPHWEGNPASLDVGTSNNSPASAALKPAFGVWDSGATLHEFRLRMLSGDAVLTND